MLYVFTRVTFIYTFSTVSYAWLKTKHLPRLIIYCEFQSIVLFVEKLRKIFGHFGGDIKFDKTKEYVNFVGSDNKKDIPILELQKCLVIDVFLYLNYEEKVESVLEIIDEMFKKCYEKS